MFNINNYNENGNSSFMEPLESLTSVKAELSDAMRPDSVDNVYNSIPFIQTEDESLTYNLHDNLRNCEIDEKTNNINNQTKKLSFQLMGRNENLLISSEDEFVKKLGCNETDKIKVIAIFGNTGDGKSHTMNSFFGSDEIFRTSSEQNSCTIGVSAAMQRKLGVLCLDTEGFLGTNSNPDKRLRMLLKILAISDIIIFRTRSERLHRDIFQFLYTASKAFQLHFAQALQSLDLPDSARALGPAIIIFQETRYTKPLESTIEESVEDKLRLTFRKMNMNIDSFSSLKYIGIQTDGSARTDYTKIHNAVMMEIENKSVRSPRQPCVIYKALKSLNLKFSGDIEKLNLNPFPEQYFTCNVTCESCDKRCQTSMGHSGLHENSSLCQYQHQFDNKVYLCKKCHQNGKKVIVTSRAQSNSESSWSGLAKYAWKGSVIECPNCGEIYRSRQYWYGNKDPEDAAVRSETVHVWKGCNLPGKGEVHSGQLILDGVTYISGAIGNVVQQPSKVLADWVADKTAPSYWKPNSEIIHCCACRKNFERTGLPKHHCRRCGEGFCHTCSAHKLPVPSRGWYEPVRVCNSCRSELMKGQGNSAPGVSPTDDKDIVVRKYGETVFNALSQVVGVLEYPKDFLKESARPNYWVEDSKAPNCSVCLIPFGTAEELLSTIYHSENNRNLEGNTTNNNEIHDKPLIAINGNNWRHHCRQCGNAVCDKCSNNRRPVPERNWFGDVRVCDACYVDKSKQD